jgi:hypothetical protein
MEMTLVKSLHNLIFFLFQVASGGLDPGIQGPRLVKMCVRCIKCFLAYFTGNKEDLETSEEEEEG